MTLHTNLETEALRGAFVDAMSQVAATVSVVTTSGPDGRFGATVSAMSSVSADGAAPTMLVCLNRDGSLGKQVRKNGVFCVNVLSADQAGVSDTFAGRRGLTQLERFSSTEWTEMTNGTPALRDAVSRFACRVQSEFVVGTHDVIVGAVDEISMSKDLEPLVYMKRGYAAVVC